MWLALPIASAVSLSHESSSSPHPGLTIDHYRASSPSTDVTVATVDLCADGVRVDATPPPSSAASTGSFAEDVGAQLASNGDFYTSGPSVYGNAVGQGIPWPIDQTGDDPDKASEWYFARYGWIAFGHDGVTFTHTEWTKENRSPTTGWAPDEVAPAPPPETIALVSGFPQLVFDGETYTCSSSTADDCFPDRTDMRSRHPRMAMGVTQDLETLLLVAVDGRTSSNSGMYGAELADVLGQLGAWQAFNIDGGGSTQLWSGSYLNDYSGNNYGGSARSVANHWAVFASGAGRPGNCVSEPACQAIPPQGATVDDASSCFQLFGDPDYWRSEDAGHNGHLWWTNAFETDVPENHAWWHLSLEDAGTYRVEVWAEPGWAVHDEVHHRIVHAGQETRVTVDPGEGGWIDLGELVFDAGGGQLIAVYDDADTDPGDDQRVVADAVRLTRLDLPQDTDHDTGQEPDSPGDSRPWTDEAATPWPRERIGGCGGSAAALLVGLLLIRRTGRRARARAPDRRAGPQDPRALR